MQIKSLIKATVISSTILIGSLFLTGCPSKITQEQMATLQEQRMKERSLNQEIQNKTSEINKLTNELQSRQGQLDECNKNKDFVQQKLRQWPNVWPE
jgi:peptidoglycan hydrolase CwlO-like protein